MRRLPTKYPSSFTALHRRYATKPTDASGTTQPSSETKEPWSDPYKHALPSNVPTYSNFREVKVNWEYVKRLLPKKIIPLMQDVSESTSPSGWRAPKETAPDLPYYVRRGPNNMPEVYLERRRDELNIKTMDFEYVELVVLRNIFGDIFACEHNLHNYLEHHLGHPVATHVDELKGLIKVKGADRTLIEQFVYDSEAEFTLVE